MCILMTDSCYCTAETNTTLQSNYPPIRMFKMSKVPFLNKELYIDKIQFTNLFNFIHIFELQTDIQFIFIIVI